MSAALKCKLVGLHERDGRQSSDVRQNFGPPTVLTGKGGDYPQTSTGLRC